MQKYNELLVSHGSALPGEHIAVAAASGKAGSNLWDVCMARKGTVLTVLFLSLSASIAYLHLATPIFTSTSRLYVEENARSLIGQDSQRDAAQVEAYLFRQCQIIRAEPILRQAILENPKEVARMYGGADDPLPLLLKNLTVDLGKKDEILTVELTSAYPVQSAKLLNSIIKCYEAYQTKQTRSNATDALNMLQKEKDAQDLLLEQRSREMVAFKQKNGEVFFTNKEGMNILTQNLATVSDHLTDARLKLIETEVSAAHENNIAIARQQILEAQQKVDGYEREFEVEKQKALAVNSAQATYQQMQLETERTTRLCDVLDSHIKELRVTVDSGSVNIQVLEAAKAEKYPTSPKKTMTLLAATAFGLVLGSGLAVLRNHMDQRLHTAAEAAELLGISVLGVIPTRRGRAAVDRSYIGRAVENLPTTALADAYQATAVAVHFAEPSEKTRKLLLTSPDRGDGKSTVCSNLAIAMAYSGRKTLLIDADLRKPVQHEIFNKLNAVGVSDVISRGMAVGDAIQQTGINGLHILASGPLPPNPAEILRSQAFSQMLKTLEETYDLIILDSPPIMVAPDARILGAQSDAAVVVLRCERTTRDEAVQAVRLLHGVGAKVLGAVFNGVAERRSTYEYYGSEHPHQVRDRMSQSKRIESAKVVEVEVG
jgi:capsular exopolysaccharide synthesis family protein